VAQDVVSSEFKPQYHKNKQTNKQNPEMDLISENLLGYKILNFFFSFHLEHMTALVKSEEE
jgi:hypothetical protein